MHGVVAAHALLLKTSSWWSLKPRSTVECFISSNSAAALEVLLTVRLIQKSSSQWCGCSENPPLNGAAAPSHIPENNLAPLTRIPLRAAADLLPIWCHPLF